MTPNATTIRSGGIKIKRASSKNRQPTADRPWGGPLAPSLYHGQTAKGFKPFRVLANHRDEIIIAFIAIFLYRVAINTQAGWVYAIVAFLTALLLMGFLLPRLALRYLKLKRPPPIPAIEDEPYTDSIILTNRLPWAVHFLQVGFRSPSPPPGENTVHHYRIERLGAHETITIQHTFTPYVRGCFAFPPIRVETGAPLGFFNAGREFIPDAVCTVHPTGPHVDEFQTPRSANHQRLRERPLSLPGQSLDFLGVREYQPGEDVRYIHWPTTGRTGRLMVKEFQDLTSQSLVLLLDTCRGADLGQGRDTPLEYMVKLATALVQYARRHAHAIMLVAPDADQVRHLAAPRLPMALDWLAMVQATGRLSWEEILIKASEYLPARSHLVVLTARTDLDPGLLTALGRRAIQSTVILVDSAGFPGHQVASGFDLQVRNLEQNGITVRRVAWGEPLDLVLRLRRGVRR